jgi:ATP-binding cassette subfamily C protein
MLGASATEGIGLMLLVPLLQLVGVEAQRGPLSGFVTTFAAALSTVNLRPTLGLVLGVYVGVVALQTVLQRRQSMLGALFEQEIVTALRTRLYRAIAGARWTHFSQERLSTCTQVLTEETARVGTATYCTIDVLVGVVTTAIYLGLAVRISPAMTTLVLAGGAILAVSVRGRIEEARLVGENYSRASSRLHAAISDHLSSLKLARGYGVEQRHTEEFDRLSKQLDDVRADTLRSATRLRQRLNVGSAGVLAAIVYVSYTVLSVSTAQLLLLLLLFARLVPRLTGLYEKSQTIASLLPSFVTVSEVERRCLAAAEPPVRAACGFDLADRIDFERVTFDYPQDSERSAVCEVSMTLGVGATTAIVGPSGAGKSTIADILMGLIEPSSGRLLVDGAPLTRDHLVAWRDSIGYVPQEPFLFHDTVRANLLWARQTASEEDLWRALRLAAADTFVAALPHGLDTVVGDRGVLVSGGERQRLSLARALVREPRLLILDEATSSLDSENEARIQQAIERLHQQMTIVVITHRLSTIQRADTIHVIDRGRLVESGSWDDLIGRGGRFRELCLAQGIDVSATSAIERSRSAVSLSFAGLRR